MKEEIERVFAAISALSPANALLVLYVSVEGLSLREAAERLQILPEVASRRLYRAKQAIRKHCAAGQEDD